MSAAVLNPQIALPKGELRLLGPLALAIEGRELHRLPRKADALLALLALQPGRPITREAAPIFSGQTAVRRRRGIACARRCWCYAVIWAAT